jgi:glucose-6-phosphate isomerase
MSKITFDYSQALNFIENKEINSLQERVSQCHKMLHHGTGAQFEVRSSALSED